MAKSYKFKAFASDVKGLRETAYSLMSGSSVIYHNLTIIPTIAGKLKDDDFELLVREVMQILDIGGREVITLRKNKYRAQQVNAKIVHDFKIMDVTHYLSAPRK